MQHRFHKITTGVLVCAFSALFFLFVSSSSLQAQTQTGTITGTVTDSTGAVLVGSTVTITNEGTDVGQTTTTDAQGRYLVPLLPIGSYDVQAKLSGFQTVVHKGITVAVGATPVVDFSLPVGKVSETVTVAGEVSQVQTQSATVSSLVTSTQIEQLPLNGRNYTQLLELAPGVIPINNSPAGQSGPGGGGTSGAFYGNQTNYTIAGGRPEGQAFLLDNEDVRDFWEHGPGSAALGTSLGVEAISEFQILTDTYSAQFAGNGAVINEASKSGTNSVHGSAYEFLRNSALDARNFFDFTSTGTTGANGAPIVTPDQKPEFRQNQFGGSVGGPIKKDKLFFFGNYEGFRNFAGVTVTENVPEPYVAENGGQLPCLISPPSTAGTPQAVTLAGFGPPGTPYPGCPASPSGVAGSTNNPIVSVPLGDGATQASAASTIAGILALYPSPNPGAADQGGYAAYTNVLPTTQSENYFLGRIDYNLSSRDTIFGRYVSDRATSNTPYAASTVNPDWPEVANSANQYFTLQDRHIASATAVNQIRFDFTRTFEKASTTQETIPNDPLSIYPGFPDADIGFGCPGCAVLGPNDALPYYLAQNKIGGGDDLVWTRGSHTFKVGVAIHRVQSNIYAPFVFGGAYSYLNEQNFMQGQPYLFLGTYPGHADSDRNFRETDYAPYFEDDWKATPKLTLNLGFRYDYATNPSGGPFNTIVSPPFPDTNAYYTDVTGMAYANGFTPVKHVFATNPNAENFEPRIGVAYDPFNDHKTSIRAGFGIFHDQIAPRLYASDYYLAPPYASALSVGFYLPFPNVFPTFTPGGPTPAITEFAGVDYQTPTSPYQMQYNLTIQRQITQGTVLSVGYIGSQGRHLFTEVDVNPPVCATSLANETSGIFTTTGCGATGVYFANPVTLADNARKNADINPATGVPYFGSLNTAEPDMTSNYNSLQVSLNHQFSHTFSGQASYTYSKCLTTGSASSGLEQDTYEQADPYNRLYDYGPCSFDIRHNFVANGVYIFPFKGNRLVEGWGLTSILRASTGLPVDIQEGSDITQLNGIQGDRPNYSGTCPGGKDQVLGKWYNWFNSTCYAPQTYGTLGDVGRNSVVGPGLFDWDMSVIKQTKVTERLNAEFRAEFFNLLNHTNFAQPSNLGVVVSGGPPGVYTLAPTGLPGDSGSIGGTFTTSREIQFAVRLTF
jgi:Carboxypeptidase regulatory-like domain/TonB dependent receptor